jgi:ribonuclease HI
MRILEAWFDGGYNWDAKTGACGYVITMDEQVKASRSLFLGHNDNIIGTQLSLTMNTCEYMGLITLLMRMVNNSSFTKEDVLHIQGDSQLVINQVSGRYKCKKEHLAPFIDITRHLLAKLPCEYTITWGSRNDNLAHEYTQYAFTQPTQCRISLKMSESLNKFINGVVSKPIPKPEFVKLDIELQRIKRHLPKEDILSHINMLLG